MYSVGTSANFPWQCLVSRSISQNSVNFINLRSQSMPHTEYVVKHSTHTNKKNITLHNKIRQMFVWKIKEKGTSISSAAWAKFVTYVSIACHSWDSWFENWHWLYFLSLFLAAHSLSQSWLWVWRSLGVPAMGAMPRRTDREHIFYHLLSASTRLWKNKVTCKHSKYVSEKFDRVTCREDWKPPNVIPGKGIYWKGNLLEREFTGKVVSLMMHICISLCWKNWYQVTIRYLGRNYEDNGDNSDFVWRWPLAIIWPSLWPYRSYLYIPVYNQKTGSTLSELSFLKW